MPARKNEREPWPEYNPGFLRPIGNGLFEDTGQDVGVWLDRADGFRWAADIAMRYAESDVAEQQARERCEAMGTHSLEAMLKQSDNQVIECQACRSNAPGPVNWFGLSCAVAVLYRLYVELLLKIIVILCRRSERKESSFPLTHDLNKLWGEAQAALLALWPERDREQQDVIRVATGHVEWLAKYDPTSQEFRYPTVAGTARDKALPQMEEMREHVVPLGNYLRQVAEGLWAERGQQRDAEADMSGNAPDTAP